MSCKKWEEPIYLYDELSEEERNQVDMHVMQCNACSQLFAEVQQLHHAVLKVADVKEAVQNPDQLTRKIMKAIAPVQKQESFITLLANHLFTRYALAACSFVLIAFFVMEQQNDFRKPRPAETITSVSKPEVILDTNSFLKVIKERTTSAVSLYSCAKTNECDYALVKYFKQKKQHENI